MTGCRIHLAESEGRKPLSLGFLLNGEEQWMSLLLTISMSGIFFPLTISRSEAVL